jgi:hypothetical protein
MGANVNTNDLFYLCYIYITNDQVFNNYYLLSKFHQFYVMRVSINILIKQSKVVKQQRN